MQIVDRKIILLSGLPGSGKSTWAKNISETAGNHCRILSFDDYKDLSLDDAMDKMYIGYDDDTIILDGLFLTDTQRADVLNAFFKRLHDNTTRYNFLGGIGIEIHEWKENRDACVQNDFNRRELSSSTTIRNAVFEPTDLTKLADQLDPVLKSYMSALTIDYSDVIVYSVKEQIANEYNSVSKKGILVSKDWCGGGTYETCWGTGGTVGSEPPVEFTELDDLLSKYCPNITFLQYKRILSQCVTIKEWKDYDYYGGSTTNYRYECDLKKLGDFLEENHLI